jgi:hypothetical protein
MSSVYKNGFTGITGREIRNICMRKGEKVVAAVV